MSELFTYKGDDCRYFIKTKNKQYAGYEVADLLNELSEENEQLKIANARWLDKSLQDRHIRYSNTNHKELTKKYLQLKEDNEHLRQMIKENVFQRYREGSLADLEFKAIAYDDIIKVKLSDESEPKVIVICKQGKKENVKSFCQMFIPFGVYYEIKELEDE